LRKARRAAVTVGLGALTSYFLDLQLGRQRRQELKDRATGLLTTMREERAKTANSGHGDGDPTGGGMPSDPVPADVLVPDPSPIIPDLAEAEPADRAGRADLGPVGAV
jgi:hypothetical protein